MQQKTAKEKIGERPKQKRLCNTIESRKEHTFDRRANQCTITQFKIHASALNDVNKINAWPYRKSC